MRSVPGSKPSWWGFRHPARSDASDPTVDRDAVRQGDSAGERSTGRAELDAAYNRGRWEEAKRRHGSGFFSFLILLVVAAAAMLFYLAAQNGSFANGGAVVDRNISQATQTVQAPFKRAAEKAGDTLENAGQNLKQRAGDQPAKP
jgi:hypothetical protein